MGRSSETDLHAAAAAATKKADSCLCRGQRRIPKMLNIAFSKVRFRGMIGTMMCKKKRMEKGQCDRQSTAIVILSLSQT